MDLEPIKNVKLLFEYFHYEDDFENEYACFRIDDIADSSMFDRLIFASNIHCGFNSCFYKLANKYYIRVRFLNLTFKDIPDNIKQKYLQKDADFICIYGWYSSSKIFELLLKSDTFYTGDLEYRDDELYCHITSENEKINREINFQDLEHDCFINENMANFSKLILEDVLVKYDHKKILYYKR
jgi:hypothetical protein